MMSPFAPTGTGWQPVRATDLRAAGSPPGTCERCGRTNIRFIHLISHATLGESLVGSECARRLCFGYSPEREEARLRKLWQRQSRG